MPNNNDVVVTVNRYTFNMTNLVELIADDTPEITELVVYNGIQREGEPMPEHQPLSPRIGECTNLTTLRLVGCSSIPPEIKNCIALSKLYLDSRFGNDDNDCRIGLPEEIILHNLTSVSIQGGSNLNTDDIISWLAVSCPNLTFLHFWNLPKYTTTQFMRMLQDNEVFIEQFQHQSSMFSFINSNLNEDDLRSFLFDIKPLYPFLPRIYLGNNNIEKNCNNRRKFGSTSYGSTRRKKQTFEAAFKKKQLKKNLEKNLKGNTQITGILNSSNYKWHR